LAAVDAATAFGGGPVVIEADTGDGCAIGGTTAEGESLLTGYVERADGVGAAEAARTASLPVSA